MPTQAKKEGNARHIAKLDIIKIQPYKEEGATIRAAATSEGKSVQRYVLEAVREKMSQERAGAVPAVPEEEGGPGVVMVSGAPPVDTGIYSRFLSLWGPDFQTALSHSGQSPEEFIEQAVEERIARELSGKEA